MIENSRNLKNHKFKSSVFRYLPLPFNKKSLDQSNSSEIKMSCPFNVFISKKSMPVRWSFHNGFICRIKKIPENQEPSTKNKSTNVQNQNIPPTGFIVKVFFLDDTLDEEYFQLNSIHNNVYLSKSLKFNLKLKTSGKVTLQPINDLQFLVPAFIEIYPSDEQVDLEVFTNYVKQCTRYDRLLLNSSATIIMEHINDKCTIRLSSGEEKIIMIDEKTFDNIPVYMKSVSPDNNWEIDEDVDENLCNLDQIVSQYV